jgi:hypothetical protein
LVSWQLWKDGAGGPKTAELENISSTDDCPWISPNRHPPESLKRQARHCLSNSPTFLAGRSGLVAKLNDPYLIAVVLFCFFCLTGLLLDADRLGLNEWYVAFHPDEVGSAPTGKVGPIPVNSTGQDARPTEPLTLIHSIY